VTREVRLIECFRHVFPTLTDAEIRGASMRHLGAWDSAALLMLLFRVETAFGLRFTRDQVNTCTSFAAMLALLNTMDHTEDYRDARGV
jgi:acyl carrier protein